MWEGLGAGAQRECGTGAAWVTARWSVIGTDPVRRSIFLQRDGEELLHSMMMGYFWQDPTIRRAYEAQPGNGGTIQGEKEALDRTSACSTSTNRGTFRALDMYNVTLCQPSSFLTALPSF